MNDIFYEYISLGHKGRPPFHKTRIKLTEGQILRLKAYEEEIRQNGEKIPSIGSTALKVKIQYRPKKVVCKRKGRRN